MENIMNGFNKTKVPEQIYKFKWTVENVSNLPEGVCIKSKDFLGESDHWWHVEFVKCSSYVEIGFVRQSSSAAIRINSEVKVLDCNGKVYYEKTDKRYKNDSYSSVAISFPKIESTILDELKLAPNDTWCFIFIIKTYKINTESIYDIGSQKICAEMSKNSFCANFYKMFENKIWTDVTLQVLNKKIEAHKLVLSAQSPVFAKMFETPMSESEKNTVFIDDVSEAAMILLINFMYSKVEIECSFETAMELYYAADKYEVFELRELCGKMLLCQLAEDNAGVLLEMADKHKDDSLKSKVMEYINSNIKSCVKKDWWFELMGKKTELGKELMNFIK